MIGDDDEIPAGPRNLTDADVVAIVVTLKRQVQNEFLRNLGKGFLGVVWSALIMLLVALVVLGMKIDGEGGLG